MGKAKFQIERRCEVCGNPFFAKTLESRYCSEKCGQVAYTRRKREAKKLKKLQELTEQIDNDRDYITVPEAVAMYSVSRTSLYQYIHDGRIPSINLCVRLIRVSRKELEDFFSKRNFDKKPARVLPKLYNLKPENCYTIGVQEAVCIFDGFMDFLSFKTLEKQGDGRAVVDEPCDYIVLNSVANMQRCLQRPGVYEHIYCFLDNDKAGMDGYGIVRNAFPAKAIDMSFRYKEYKDVNDCLIGRKKA